MFLKDKYFHSVHPYNESYYDVEKGLEIKLLKLGRIFESNAILSNNKIIEKYGISYRHPCKHINGKDFISISKHLYAEEECDVEYKNTHSIQNFEDSFQSFVIQEPSIILSSKIKDELKMYSFGIYLERLVLNEIPLKYMEGISIIANGPLRPFFVDVSKEEFDKCYFDDSFYKNCIYIKQLDGIINLLNQYGYDVPIVDIISGKEYKDNLEYRQYINEIEKNNGKRTK